MNNHAENALNKKRQRNDQEEPGLLDPLRAEKKKSKLSASSPSLSSHHDTQSDDIDDVITSPDSHINQLNNECLDIILCYFNTVEHLRLMSVCKRWNTLCTNKISLLTTIDSTQLCQEYDESQQLVERCVMTVIA